MLEKKSLPSAVDDAADVMAHYQQGAKKQKNRALHTIAPLLFSMLSLSAIATFLTS